MKSNQGWLCRCVCVDTSCKEGRQELAAALCYSPWATSLFGTAPSNPAGSRSLRRCSARSGKAGAEGTGPVPFQGDYGCSEWVRFYLASPRCVPSAPHRGGRGCAERVSPAARGSSFGQSCQASPEQPHNSRLVPRKSCFRGRYEKARSEERNLFLVCFSRNHTF